MNNRIGITKKGKKEVKNVASSINTFTKKKKETEAIWLVNESI